MSGGWQPPKYGQMVAESAIPWKPPVALDAGALATGVAVGLTLGAFLLWVAFALAAAKADALRPVMAGSWRRPTASWLAVAVGNAEMFAVWLAMVWEPAACAETGIDAAADGCANALPAPTELITNAMIDDNATAMTLICLPCT
jgi:hypothetical protein